MITFFAGESPKSVRFRIKNLRVVLLPVKPFMTGYHRALTLSIFLKTRRTNNTDLEELSFVMPADRRCSQ